MPEIVINWQVMRDFGWAAPVSTLHAYADGRFVETVFHGLNGFFRDDSGQLYLDSNEGWGVFSISSFDLVNGETLFAED